ncbi:DUF932 domain-containing protein [Rhizosphaericola mali]|uniref:DUF945 domain-containing protein n=1 Tax=Rhizosphaericola mali TaxID=2545455 RepID=A0A5P2G542_9BACT|nr:DUF932 domain-containing protein [Rhizosphaericola mali]QES88942.1 DUF945 domain-containing protein [Rhizosphaericola mali]
MAHNLNFNEQTGKYSFFSVKQKAWHGLGQIVSDYPTSAEAMQYAGLDFEVIKSPLFTSGRTMSIGDCGELEEANDILVHNAFATLRTDSNQPLGVVGNDYNIIQNREAFAFFDAIVGGGNGILYETAGALGNGERIFITAKLPDYIKVGNNDYIEQYLFLTTSHDGSGSITAAFTPVRICCNNTLNAALKNMSNVVRFRHTNGAAGKLVEAHRVMGIATANSKAMEETFNHFAKIHITDKEVRRLIEMAMAPNKETLQLLQGHQYGDLSTVFKNQCEEVFSYAMTSDTQQFETTKGTVFGAYNAITGYFQNLRSYKDEEAKLKSLVYGGTAATKAQKALDLCSAFAIEGKEILLMN